MTPKQEKYLTEKFIRPLVKKVLRENDNYDDLYADIQDEIKKIYNWSKTRMDSKLNETMVNQYVKTIKNILDRIEKIQSDII